jgi:hypothetical protein
MASPAVVSVIVVVPDPFLARHALSVGGSVVVLSLSGSVVAVSLSGAVASSGLSGFAVVV